MQIMVPRRLIFCSAARPVNLWLFLRRRPLETSPKRFIAKDKDSCAVLELRRVHHTASQSAAIILTHSGREEIVIVSDRQFDIAVL